MVSPYIFGGDGVKKNKNDSLRNKTGTTKLSGAQNFAESLPDAESHPPVNFGKQNFDTNELVSPPSIIEDTTRRLEKELRQK